MAGGAFEQKDADGRLGSVPRTARRDHFVGPQKLATVDDVEAFVRRAQPGQEFTYCEAPDLIRGETSARVAQLVGSGLLRPHHRRRAGGGFEFYVVRTGKAPQRPADPRDEALGDTATETIFRLIKRAANFGQDCPSDVELADGSGLNSRDQAQWRVRKLIAAGLIESQVVYERGVPKRVVTIIETKWAGKAAGKRTRLPERWEALEQAARRDVRAKGGVK